MKAYIIANLSNSHYIEKAQKIIDSLMKIESLDCFLDEESNALLKYKYPTEDIENAEIIISIGGDGTLLYSGQYALKLDLPLLGINAGRAGYLCKLQADNILKEKKIDMSQFRVSKRNVLKMKYENKDYVAINDFLFVSQHPGNTCEVKVSRKEKEHSCQCSGILLSTSTGSTAYNMSLGGAILEPELELCELSVIAPKDAKSNSYVFDCKETITIENIRPQDPIDIYGDGKYIGSFIRPVQIVKARKKLKLIQ